MCLKHRPGSIVESLGELLSGGNGVGPEPSSPEAPGGGWAGSTLELTGPLVSACLGARPTIRFEAKQQQQQMKKDKEVVKAAVQPCHMPPRK